MVPAAEGFSPTIAMGLFALYVVVVSLLRMMSEQEFYRLTAMKKLWGRTRGLIFHFLANVALPLVAGIVFLSHGLISLPGHQGTINSYDPVPHAHVVQRLIIAPPPAEESAAEETAPHLEFEQLVHSWSHLPTSP